MNKNVSSCIDLNDFFDVEENGSHLILNYKNPPQHLTVYDPGLYHTAICKSQVCKVDKNDGMLYYRGVKITDKLEDDFLDVAYHILFGDDLSKKEQFKQSVDFHFTLHTKQKNLLDAIPMSTHPMDVLSIATIALGGIEAECIRNQDDLIEKTAFIIAQVAVSVCYYYLKLNHLPWEPVNSPGYAQKIISQMHPTMDKEKIQALSKILNTIMTLHCEHGLNCSAATVRNVASAKGALYPAVASGMAAFNGSIHGGASQLVSAMYDELLESKGSVDEYIDGKIARKELVMGFGQRTYNRIMDCWDPRVETMYKILTDPQFNFPEVQNQKDIALKLMERVLNDPFFQSRNLTPNPDLFNCIFFKLFGVPRQMNTTMLALGRIVGWVSNYIQHTQDKYPLTRPCDIG